MITTLNFHLIKACNYSCKFCYATFNDIIVKGISKTEQFEIIQLLAESNKFKKINFAGGEPTLIPHISELIKFAKALGFETSIVTNASKIDFQWVAENSKYLDILALSIDSASDEINRAIGRSQKLITIDVEKLKSIANACHLFGVNLKINTVVCQFNKTDQLVDLINELNPYRWKILQATKVEGQNEEQFDTIKVSSLEFTEYIEINKVKLSLSIKLVKEEDKIIQGSYLMVDMLGRFFDSTQMKHNYSDSIFKIGVEKALKHISIDEDKFKLREGNYSFIKKIAS